MLKRQLYSSYNYSRFERRHNFIKRVTVVIIFIAIIGMVMTFLNKIKKYLPESNNIENIFNESNNNSTR